MSDIMLNDILHLTDEEIAKSKIGLNMQWGGTSHFQRWYESDADNRDTDFTYASYQASRKNFYVGEWCFGFVRLDNPDKWLLVSAGEITEVPEIEEYAPCKHIELERFQGLVGRLIIEYHKGNTFSRYIFKMDGIIENAKVSEILPNIYEPIKFDGFEKVHLDFKTLQLVLSSERYQDDNVISQSVPMRL